MRQFTKRVSENTFIRHNVILFAGSLGMGLLNYLYYPVLGRLLHPGSFGEVQVLASLFAQVTIFLSVLGLITVNIIANYEDERQRNQVILELERLAAFVGVGLLAVALLSSALLKNFFHFNSTWPFPVLALAVLVSVPLTFRTAYLRGLKHFGLVSMLGIIGSAADLILAVAFVLAGLGTTGAILGLVAGQAVAFGFATVQARRRGFSESWRASMMRLPDLKLIRPELKYALLVLICSLSMTGMYSIDTIVVKHYFDAHTAGLYAGISTVARIVFFLTGSISGVLLPAIKLHHQPRENRQTLRKSVVLMVLIGGATLLGFALMPRLIIHILMGSKYLPLAFLLPRLSLVLFTISLLNLFMLYFMALRRYGIALVVIMGLAITYGLLRAHHQTLEAVINSLLYGSLAMMGLLVIWSGIDRLKRSNTNLGEHSS
jgi:O-antigen/teichoic acid export membrane protein